MFMSEEIEKQETKQWKTAATFPTYEEASAEKEKLSKTNELVKIRMGGRGKLFRVKVWNTPKEKTTNKKTKKGKNENKKVRSGQTSE